jgi:succinate-semialdehyde dehydrogenase/glutarate-semialdehyde dehydrogenase
MRPHTTISPTSGKLAKSFPEISNQEVEIALEEAHHTYVTDWRSRSLAVRARVVAHAAAIMRERSEELAGCITLEMGKLIAQSHFEVEFSAAILMYYANHGEQFLATRNVPEAPGYVITTEPTRVLVAIEPPPSAARFMALIADEIFR